MVLDSIRKWLNLRDGEGRRLFPLLLLMFLTLTNLILLKSTASSIFLVDLGADQLPNAYLWVAATAGVSTLFFSGLARRFRLTFLIQLVQLFTAAFAIWFAYYLDHHAEYTPWLVYCLYVWSNLYGVITVSQVYLLGGELFGLREAKRLFIWVGVAAISGGVFGGYLTSVLAQFGSKIILLWVASGLSIAGFLVCWLLKNYAHQPKQETEPKQLIEKWQEFWYPFHYLRNSKYLHLVGGIVFSAVLVAKLVEYQYSSMAVVRYPEVESLAAFLGFWMSTISLISLLIQVVGTKFALQYFGVGRSLQLLPACLLAAMLLFLAFPLLWAIVIARVIDGGFKQSLHKSAFELLLLPLPEEEKKVSKTFIDIFVDSIATGLSGLLLIFFIRQSDLPVQAVSLLIISLIIVWIILNRYLSKEYLNIFRLKLEYKSYDEVRPIVKVSEPKVLQGMVQIMREGNVSQIRYVLNKIAKIKPQTIFEEPLLRLLDHPHSDIRAGAINCLTNYRKVDIHHYIFDFIENDPAISVRVEALYYLVHHQPREQIKHLIQYLDRDERMTGDIALLTLIGEVNGNPVLWNELRMGERLDSLVALVDMMPENNQRQELILLATKAIEAAQASVHYERLAAWLPTARRDVRKGILNAFDTLLDRSFLPALWHTLGTVEAYHAISVMGRYNERKLLPFLMSKDLHEDYQKARHIPRILEQLPTPHVVDFLMQWLEHPNYDQRKEALRALSNIQKQRPRLQFDRSGMQRLLLEEASLFQRMLQLLYTQVEQFSDDPEPVRAARRSLLKLLETRLDDNINRIFLLLNLRFATNDYEKIYNNLRSSEATRRENALEFLDNLLEPSLKKLILPVAQQVVLDWPFQKSHPTRPIDSLEEESCFREIFALEDPQLSLLLLYFIRTAQNRNHLDIVEPLLNNQYASVREEALTTQQYLDQMP